MDSIYMRWSGCGAFEARLGDVNIAFDPYLFPELLENAEPIYDYIFISHEHFDHCHPPTLQKLCKGDRFKKLIVSPGCLDPDQPVNEKYRGAAFHRDLPITKHIPAESVQVAYPKYLRELKEPEKGRGFPGPFEFELGPLHVETIESGENQSPQLPTVGYLVTHKEKELSILHGGDLLGSYPSLEGIRGKVDYFVQMKMGLSGGSEPPDYSYYLTDFLDLVQPRFTIPTHYRTDRTTDPIPDGHWPPNIDDVGAFFEWTRETVGDRTEILPFTAGVEYEIELPSKKVQWKWAWYNSWTEPPWEKEGFAE